MRSEVLCIIISFFIIILTDFFFCVCFYVYIYIGNKMTDSRDGSSEREGSSSSSSLESVASSSDDENVEIIFPPPPPSVVSSHALSTSGINDRNSTITMPSGYRGLSVRQQMLSGASSTFVPSPRGTLSSSTSSSGGFGASIAAALEQRKRDREERAEEKRQQRREEERQNPELVKKDKEVGVFMTAAYRDASRHRLLPSSTTSSPSTKEQSAREFSSAEERGRAAHQDAVRDSHGASNAHGHQHEVKSDDERDENPLDSFIKSLEASAAKEEQTPAPTSSGRSGNDHTALLDINEGSKVHEKGNRGGETMESKMNELTRSEGMDAQTSGALACGRLNSSSAVSSLSGTSSSTPSALRLNEDISEILTAPHEPRQTALQSLECAVVERVSRKLLSFDQLYRLQLRSTKRIQSCL